MRLASGEFPVICEETGSKILFIQNFEFDFNGTRIWNPTIKYPKKNFFT